MCGMHDPACYTRHGRSMVLGHRVVSAVLAQVLDRKGYGLFKAVQIQLHTGLNYTVQYLIFARGYIFPNCLVNLSRTQWACYCLSRLHQPTLFFGLGTTFPGAQRL